MSTMITRIYDSAAKAAKVVQALQGAGQRNVHQFSGPSGKGKIDRKALVTDMMAAHVWNSHAEAYVDHLAKGQSLVVVHAPFSTGLSATNIMDSAGPISSGFATTRHRADYVWDDRTPLSSALCLPVLANTKLPIETLTGISSLSKGSGFISDWFGLPMLKHGAAHETTSMGFPLLSDKATPLSSALGMGTLSHNPTPLSSIFGIPVLSRRM